MGEPVRSEAASPGLRAGQLGTLHVWALGVGIVICGQYFGWNLGLKDNGPVALLIASLVVCLLFLAWVLTLSELAVAMPSADGPLAYGRRAGGGGLGFLMGWSLLLECLFGGVATALAAGGYVAFLLDPAAPDGQVAVAVGLLTVAVFFALQVWGVREQARALVLMTYAALGGLIVFWLAAATNFSWERVWASPPLPAGKGWAAVLDAVPFALWWLIIIEAAALSAEETAAPERAVPRGLTWAVVTVIGLVVLTTVTACGAADYPRIAERDGKDVTYPLAEVIRLTPAGRHPAVLYGFGAVALFGLVASYHGLLYGASRQAFALGRAGLLPGRLDRVHPTRHTPVRSLVACSLVTAGFVVANLWFEDAVKVAVLVAGFAALVLYVLSMGCLLRLRRREPGLFARHAAPLGLLLPACVVLLSAVALVVYPRLDAKVLPLAGGLYAAGVVLAWAARHRRPPAGAAAAPAPLGPGTARAGRGWLHAGASAALVVALGIAGAMAAAAFGLFGLDAVPPEPWAAVALGLLGVTLAAVSAVGLRHGRPAAQRGEP